MDGHDGCHDGWMPCHVAKDRVYDGIGQPECCYVERGGSVIVSNLSMMDDASPEVLEYVENAPNIHRRSANRITPDGCKLMVTLGASAHATHPPSLNSGQAESPSPIDHIVHVS